MTSINTKPMNTNFTLNYRELLIYSLAVFLFTTINLNAQCPTVINPNPSICIGAGYTFADLSGDASIVTDGGNGISWYTQEIGGDLIPLTDLVQTDVYYVDDNTGACGVRQSVTVIFQVPIPSGSVESIYCTNEGATIQTFIDDEMASFIPLGGGVSVYYDLGLINPAGTSDILPVGGTEYYIVFDNGGGGCTSQIKLGSTAVFPAPADPTPATPQLFCSDSSPTVGDLDPGTSQPHNWYGAIDLSGNPNPATLLAASTGLVNGIYYVQINTGFCKSNTIPVTVTVDDPFDPGSSSSLDYCEGDLLPASLTLYNELGGLPDTNGIWNGPLSTSPDSDGIVDLSVLTIPDVYTFTYTVPANGACPERSADVAITIHETLSSGTANPPVKFCIGEVTPSQTYNLFDLLEGEDQILGVWSDDNTSGALTVNDVAIDALALLGVGNYNFTYTQNALPNPCPEESTQVQIQILADPNAGTAINQVFCENELVSNFDLFTALDGSQDNNLGVWIEDASGVTVSDPTLVDITGFTTVGSPYSYTYTIDNTVCVDAETITITVEPAPESGTALAPVEFCITEITAGQTYDLFDLLTADAEQTGTWYVGTDTSGAVATNPIDISLLSAGTINYTYDVDLVGLCDDVDVAIQFIIKPAPNTGTPKAPSQYCLDELAGAATLDLLGELTGVVTPGGIWTDDDSSGALSGNQVNINALPLVVASYNFSYTVFDPTTNCTGSSTVTVNVTDAPESGEVNTPKVYCDFNAVGQTFDLFDLLTVDADQTGTWYVGSDTSGVITSNLVDVEQLSIIGSGTYSFTYDVDAIGGCDDDNKTVEIIIISAANVGVPNASNPATYCESVLPTSTALNLFDLLDGEDEVSGVWSWLDPDGTGALTNNILDLSLLENIGTYNFTYTIDGGTSCLSSSTVSVEVLLSPESGAVNPPEAFCAANITGGQTFDLFDLLEGEDPTGTWYIGSDTSGLVTTNSVDISLLPVGIHNFTFDVDALVINSCDDDDKTVTIAIIAAPDTGTPELSVPPICINDLVTSSPLNLFDLLNGGDELSGTWFDEANIALASSMLDISGFAIGDYNFTYTIDGGASCISSTAVVLSIVDVPNSGSPIAGVEFCVVETIGQSLDLFNLLVDQDAGGTWNDDDLTAALSGNIVDLDAIVALDPTSLVPLTYNFTYSVDAIGACLASQTTVSFVIRPDTASPSVVTATQEFCNSSIIATIADLSATGDLIQWYDDPIVGSPLAGTTNLEDNKTYYATQTDASTGCESSTRTAVLARVYETPNSGSLSASPILACNDNIAIDLTAGLDGTQDITGVWQDVDAVGASITGNILNATGLAAGDYVFRYYVDAGPCGDASTDITITLDAPLNPGADIALPLCSNNAPLNLFTVLIGADPDGEWTAPDSSISSGVFDPAVDSPGIYTYTLTNACGIFSSQVDVSIILAPDAGVTPSGDITICVVDPPIDLYRILGTTQFDGTWSANLIGDPTAFNPEDSPTDYPPGSYTFTYTILASDRFPCADDSSASVTIIVSDILAPVVTNSNPEICLQAEPSISSLESFLTIDLAATAVTWYEDAALTIPADPTYMLQITDTGKVYYATQTNASGCESSTISDPITVTIIDTPTPTLVNTPKELCFNTNPTLSILSEDVVEYDPSSSAYDLVWYDSDIGGTAFSATDLLVNGQSYFASLTDNATGCESNVRLEVIPDLTGCKILPDGFSPNGDGVNDTFGFNNLDVTYPNFELEIYNRNGNVVYKGDANTPRFNGVSNQPNITFKGDLPVGVYFYIFKFNDGENKPVQGHLYLSR